MGLMDRKDLVVGHLYGVGLMGRRIIELQEPLDARVMNFRTTILYGQWPV